jgi:hypothetical protein
MSTEEELIDEEVQTPIQSVESILSSENSKPTKLNKDGRPRKQLNDEAKQKLAKAREKANAIRLQNHAKRLGDKAEKMNLTANKTLNKNELKEEEEPKEEVKEEVKEDVKEVKKPKGKKKTKIIVEQSSEDSDEFEPNDNVVFVKRVSRKKKEVPVVPEPELQMEQMPPEPPPPPVTRQQLTPQQLLLQKQYSAMFSGGFINKRSYY